jgi:hypothetical protein
MGSKSLWVGEPTKPLISFYAHDEYSMLPHGQHWAAHGALAGASKEIGNKHDIKREMHHRMATSVTARMGDQGIRGTVEKYHFDPATAGPRVSQLDSKKFEHESDYKPALTDIESRWKEINRDRKVDSGVLSAASNLLASPKPKVLQSIKRNHPEVFSSQFLEVNSDSYHDVIDLRTGNWAEIHPDVYFPQ